MTLSRRDRVVWSQPRPASRPSPRVRVPSLCAARAAFELLRRGRSPSACGLLPHGGYCCRFEVLAWIPFREVARARAREASCSPRLNAARRSTVALEFARATAPSGRRECRACVVSWGRRDITSSSSRAANSTRIRGAHLRGDVAGGARAIPRKTSSRSRRAGDQRAPAASVNGARCAHPPYSRPRAGSANLEVSAPVRERGSIVCIGATSRIACASSESCERNEARLENARIADGTFESEFLANFATIYTRSPLSASRSFCAAKSQRRSLGRALVAGAACGVLALVEV